ncbi:MAG: tetratricopeptide repeat protein [Candidatus Melainabacteria bacterium]|nr:tetratricopeptide repeat protein [Candidatus Melainabacteria bacterium]
MDPELSEIAHRVQENTAKEADLTRLTELANKQPKDANLHYLLGQYLENKGFEQLAIDAYTRSLACDSSFKPAHYQRCLVLLRVNDIEPAMVEVALCQKMFANDGDKLFRIGQALDQAGKHDDAKRFFHKSTLAGHKNKGHGLTLANMKVYQGKFDEALEAVDWDLKVNSNDPQANLFKADLLLRMKRDEEAMACYIKAAKNGPCEQGTAATVARKLVELKRYPEAFTAALFDLLCPQPNDVAMEQSKAYAQHLLLKFPDKQSQAIVNSITADVQKLRRCRYLRLSLGDIYDRINRPARAMEQYQLAIHDCPSPYTDDTVLARGYFRLGRDYESAHRNHREALDLYRRAHALAPDDREITANYSRLDQRLKNRKNDVAAHLKDAWYSFWKLVSPPMQTY